MFNFAEMFPDYDVDELGNVYKHNEKIKTLTLGKPAWNRGIKMPEEFCRRCSISAKKRWEREREKRQK